MGVFVDEDLVVVHEIDKVLNSVDLVLGEGND